MFIIKELIKKILEFINNNTDFREKQKMDENKKLNNKIPSVTIISFFSINCNKCFDVTLITTTINIQILFHDMNV
jgi:hypothetical protein